MKGDSAKPPTMKMNCKVSMHQKSWDASQVYLDMDVAVAERLVELFSQELTRPLDRELEQGRHLRTGRVSICGTSEQRDLRSDLDLTGANSSRVVIV